MWYVNVKDPKHIVIILDIESDHTYYVKEIGTTKRYAYTSRGAPLFKLAFDTTFKPLERKSHLPKWF